MLKNLKILKNPPKKFKTFFLNIVEKKLPQKIREIILQFFFKHFPVIFFSFLQEYLEDFESLLEQNPAKSGQLRMLHFACASRARKRTVTLTRPSRDEPLQFTLMGGSERGFGIFLEKVERGSKASEIGLKRGDQILEVNRRSFEQNMSLEKATLILKENTHLEMNVKSNLLGNFYFFTVFKNYYKKSHFYSASEASYVYYFFISLFFQIHFFSKFAFSILFLA